MPAPATNREYHIFDQSSRVARAWYTEAEKMIEIEFPDTVRVLFFEVEAATWQRFIRADSPGRFLHDILERHPYRRR